MVEFLPLIRQKSVAQPCDTLDQAKEKATKITEDLKLYGRLGAIGEVVAEQVPITDDLTFVVLPAYIRKHKADK